MRSSELIAMLTDSRRRTLDLVADLTDEQMKVPLLDIINPLIWEMGHVAWFQETWALRRLRGRESVRPDADALWDSMAIAHDTRWELPLPSRAETLQYMEDVLERVIGALPAGEVPEPEAYFHWLVAMHEDMHDEAFTYTRQTLGYAEP
ncbi:MAG TPA: DinB family protein, partial [Bryobacterales bacterium]|nr:DinB family protein [Bryobacterales bacterium]